MFIDIKEIQSLIEEIQSMPLGAKEIDFISSVWHFITMDKPKLSQKQYNYLKLLASRKVKGTRVEIYENGS